MTETRTSVDDRTRAALRRFPLLLAAASLLAACQGPYPYRLSVEKFGASRPSALAPADGGKTSPIEVTPLGSSTPAAKEATSPAKTPKTAERTLKVAPLSVTPARGVPRASSGALHRLRVEPFYTRSAGAGGSASSARLPYDLFVLPVRLPEGIIAESGTLDVTEAVLSVMQEKLADALRQRQVFSSVTTRDTEATREPSLDRTEEQLELELSLTGLRLRFLGRTSWAWPNLLLNLLLGFVSFWVEDEIYELEFTPALEWRFAGGGVDREWRGARIVNTDTLSFHQRARVRDYFYACFSPTTFLKADAAEVAAHLVPTMLRVPLDAFIDRVGTPTAPTVDVAEENDDSREPTLTEGEDTSEDRTDE